LQGTSGNQVGDQRHFEWLPCIFHKAPDPFQHGKGRMAFIQMTDFRPDAKRAKQSPSADPEEQFFLEAQPQQENRTPRFPLAADCIWGG